MSTRAADPRGRLRACLLAAAALLGACSVRGESPPLQPVTIVTGWTGGAFYPLGAALADIYNQRLPGVRAQAQFTGASAFNVQAIQSGRAELGFSQSDVAYSAFTRGMGGDERPYRRLRSMAVIYVNTVQIVVRRASAIRQLADLRSRRVGVGGEPGSGTETAARTILESYGMTYRELDARFMSFGDAVAGMRDGQLDAVVMVTSYPVPAITAVFDPAEHALLSLDASAVHRIRSRFPFFKTVVIPASTYRGQVSDVQTIGVDNLLLCLDSLPDALVYDMTRLLFEELPRLAKDHVTARMIDTEQAPATPIPLHPGAARYYRERELFQ